MSILRQALDEERAAGCARAPTFNEHDDAERLRAIARSMTYNDSAREARDKHALYEIALRLGSSSYAHQRRKTDSTALIPSERQEAAAAGQGERAEFDVLNVVTQQALAGRITEMGVMVEACHAIRAAVRASLPASPSQGQSHGASPVMPHGWVPLTIEHDPGYPEEIAFGPQIMMDRLKKWLDRYFAMLAAAPAQPAQGEPDLRGIDVFEASEIRGFVARGAISSTSEFVLVADLQKIIARASMPASPATPRRASSAAEGTDMSNSEREAFEAWAASQDWLSDKYGSFNFRRLHTEYVDMTVERARRAFFAGRATLPAPDRTHDTARLDWLEQEAKKSRTGVALSYTRYVEEGQVLEHGYRLMRWHFATDFKRDIRSAIDAARAASSQPAQGNA